MAVGKRCGEEDSNCLGENLQKKDGRFIKVSLHRETLKIEGGKILGRFGKEFASRKKIKGEEKRESRSSLSE